jgi:hypothetical protein
MAATTRAELHDNPQVGSLQIRTVVLGDIGRFQFGQDRDLFDDIIDFILGILDINDFDSN